MRWPRQRRDRARRDPRAGDRDGGDRSAAAWAPPDAELVGIDESEAMLEVARSIRLPPGSRWVGAAGGSVAGRAVRSRRSALCVHHLDGGEKRRPVRADRARPAPRGRFVLGDVVVPVDPADASHLADAGIRPPEHGRRSDAVARRRRL